MSPKRKHNFSVTNDQPSTMRLQVFLSHNGVCSRRKAMDLIQDGHVMVNGDVVKEPSTQINPMIDQVSVDHQLVTEKKYDYVLLNKPKGLITSKARDAGHQNIYDLLPKTYHHLAPVGRLDRDTEGLLLLTNDGEVTYQLTHPRFNIDKTYFVRVQGRLDLATKLKLQKGIYIGRHKTAPAKIQILKPTAYETEFLLTIHEGQKRQIRIMMAIVDHKVKYLKRIAQGPLTLGPLKPGFYRRLSDGEIRKLKLLVGAHMNAGRSKGGN